MPLTSESIRALMQWSYIGPCEVLPVSMPFAWREPRTKSTPLLMISPYGPEPGVYPLARKAITDRLVTAVLLPSGLGQYPSACCCLAR